MQPPIVWTVSGEPKRLDATRQHLEGPSKIGDNLYSHHPIIYSDGTRLYACWSVHSTQEDAAGQFVRWVTSEDGRTWTVQGELFPSYSTYNRGSTTARSDGLATIAGEFVEVRRQLYATATIAYRSGGSLAGVGRIARSVDPQTKALGPIFFLRTTTPSEMPSIPWPPLGTGLYAAAAALLRAHFDVPESLGKFDFFGTPGVDLGDGGGALKWSAWAAPVPQHFVEPTQVRRSDGTLLRLWRSVVAGEQGWLWSYQGIADQTNGDRPEQTPIPNGASMPFLLKLSTGKILLFGNLDNTQRDRPTLHVATSEDGYTFDRWYVVESGRASPRFRYMNSSSLDFRTGGPSYPHACEHDGYIYTTYSVHKEDICVARFPVSMPVVPDISGVASALFGMLV